MIQERVSIGRLKARLSEYLRRAMAGGVVVVTDRGKPVARLTGLDEEPFVEARILDLVEGGLARRPNGPLDLRALRRSRPTDSEGRSLEVVLEERAEGR